MFKAHYRLVSILLAFVLVFMPFANLAFASGTNVAQTDLEEQMRQHLKQFREESLDQKTYEEKAQAILENSSASSEQGALSTQHQPNDLVRVIIKVEGLSVLEQLSQLDTVRDSSTQYSSLENNIESKQVDLLNRLKSQRIQFQSKQQFKYVLNAVSGNVLFKDIERIKKIDGVIDVRIANEYFPNNVDANNPDMYFSAPIIGADQAWSSEYDGEGTIVAIVDTGVNYFHPAFGGNGKETLALGGTTDLSPETGNGTGYNDRVVGGYNWADGNNDIVDRTSSQHGVHVAGTVAGNDATKTYSGESFKGVAPGAKILAEKVFSNDPDRASTLADEVIAGIEHAVANGADVINLSLGSPAGMVLEDDPEIQAIKNATDQNVVMSISAGNEGIATYTLPFAENRDFGMVGSPSIAETSISVAASENGAAMFEYFSLNSAIGDLTDVPMNVVSELPSFSDLNGTYDVVYVGLGDAAGYQNKDVRGKVALIQRGTYSFSDKIANAKAHGAVAAIIFNNAANAGYISMFVSGEEGIPASFILHENGVAIAEKLASNPVQVTFNDEPKGFDLAGDTMTDFSSWGPGPSLDFKPTLTAPGGNIYSSMGNNEYGLMSGTSMAAPHVTGASAVVIQSFKDRGYVDYTQNDVKAVLSNTAKVLLDPNYPYPVRQQGSGRIQLDQAVQSEVIVTTTDDQVGVALKSFDNSSVTFTLKAKNFGAEDVSYALNGDAYKDLLDNTNTYNFLALEPIEGATVTFDQDTLVVPANGEATFSVTLTLPSGLEKNQFVDGWIYLNTSEESGEPSLVVPYFGFYGDWNEPSVIDPHWADEKTSWFMTALYDWYDGFDLGTGFSGEYNGENAAFSPNGDNYREMILPVYSLLRNAKTFEVNVLNSENKKLRTLSVANDIRKSYVDNPFTYFSPWDGTVSGELVQDDQYYIQAVVQPYGVGNGRTQEFILPVKVDTVDPLVSGQLVNSGENTTLQITGSDNLSGIWGFIYEVIDSNGISLGYDVVEATETENGYTAEVVLDTTNISKVYVGTEDFAGNFTMAAVGDGPFELYSSYVDEDEAYVQFNWYTGPEVDDIHVTVDEGEAISLKETALDDSWGWHYALPLTYGNHTITIEVLDAEGNALSIFNQEANDINALGLDSDETITVFNHDPFADVTYYAMSDRVDTVQIAVYESEEVLEETTIEDSYTDYTFEYEAPKGESTLVLNAFDTLGNLLGKQEVIVNNIKAFDVTFEQEFYHVTDAVYQPIKFAVGEDTEFVKFSVYDSKDVAVVDDVYVYDRATVTGDVYEYNLNLSNFNEGRYQLELNAFDRFGEYLESSIADLYLYPTGDLKYTIDQQTFRTNQDTFNVVWDYDRTVTDAVYAMVDGEVQALTSDATELEFDMTPFNDGKRVSVEIFTKNTSGKVTGRLFFNVYRDLTAPAWYFDYPTYYEFFNARDNRAEVFAYTLDMDLDPSSVTLFVPGMDQAVSVDPINYGFAYLVNEYVQFTEEGAQNIELKYSDIAGNSGYHHRKVIVDLHSPVFDLDLPNVTLEQTSDVEGDLVYEGSYQTSASSINLKGTITENLTSFDFYVNDNQLLGELPSKSQIVLGSTDARQFLTRYTLEEGMNDITLYAVDGAGNESTIVLHVNKVRSSGSSSGGGVILPPVNEKVEEKETKQGKVTITTDEEGKKSADVVVSKEKISADIKDETKANVEIDLTDLSTDEVGQISVLLDNETVEELIKANKGLVINGADFVIEISLANLSQLKGNNGLNIKVKVDSPEKKNGVKIHALEETNIVSKVYTLEGEGTLVEPITVTLKYTGATDSRLVGAYMAEKDGWKFVGNVTGWNESEVKLKTKEFGSFAAIELSKQFDDTTKHWAKDEVKVMAAQHILKGNTDDTFAPNANVTRAEFATMLVRILGLDTALDSTVSYSDVTDTAWYAQYVYAASETGIVQGFDGKFDPNAKLSRQDMVVMLMRAVNKGLPEVLNTTDATSTFADQAKISSYAQEFVNLAAANKLVTGVNDTEFAPLNNATRAEAATILYRLFFQ